MKNSLSTRPTTHLLLLSRCLVNSLGGGHGQALEVKLQYCGPETLSSNWVSQKVIALNLVLTTDRSEVI